MEISEFTIVGLSKPTIAISEKDFELYGCPDCGGIFGYSMMSVGQAATWNCECGQNLIIVAGGLKQSPIGIGSNPTIYLDVQAHPREGQVIDRPKLIEERAQAISDNELVDLSKWLSLGYGQATEATAVSRHSSKSRILPIVAANPENSNVEVTWFGQNYYFYFLGVELERAVPATLLYPIHTIFGSYALSGHVNRATAPPLTNFEKAYHNCQMVSCFGADCGPSGWEAALVIRYLQAVSMLDTEAILDICLRKTEYGSVDCIDGNSMQMNQLFDVVGLRTDGNPIYHGTIQDIPTNIFEKVEVDVFDTLLRGSSVHVTMADGVPLPMLGLEGCIYTDVKDTVLGDYVPEKVQPNRVNNLYGEYLISKILLKLIHPSRERYLEEQVRQKGIAFPMSWANWHVKPGTREFTINVPNPLDAVMTAFHLIKVIAPMMR